MTPREAFKLGFIARCVKGGMSGEETRAHVKRAFIDIAAAGRLLKDVSIPALLTAAAVPPVIGGMGAYAKNQLLDSDASEDLTLAKNEEMIRTYRDMAERIRRKHSQQQANKLRAKNRQVFL